MSRERDRESEGERGGDRARKKDGREVTISVFQTQNTREA